MGVDLTRADLDNIVEDCCGGPKPKLSPVQVAAELGATHCHGPAPRDLLDGDTAAKIAYREQPPTAAELLAAVKDAAAKLRTMLRAAWNGQAILPDDYKVLRYHVYEIEDRLEGLP